MSDELETEPAEDLIPVQTYACSFCGGDGLNLKGWDEEGNDILEECLECGGTGIYEGA